MLVKKFEDGKNWAAYVQCPYCKNPDLGTTMEFDPELGRFKKYDCGACKACFHNYPLRWALVNKSQTQKSPSPDPCPQ